MKIKIESSQLKEALSVLKRTTTTRSPLTVLENVLLQGEGSSLTLMTTNLVAGIRTTIPAEVKRPGATTVSVSRLLAIIGPIDEEIDLVLDEKTETLKLAWGKSKAQIKGIPAIEMPPFPKMPEELADIPAPEIRLGIQRTIHAALTDESRIQLNGLLFRMKGGILTIAGADGFRMAEAQTSVDAKGDMEIIVPLQIVGILNQILDDKVSIGQNEKNIFVHTDKYDLAAVSINADYPPYEQIIPNHPHKTVVSSERLLKLLAQAEVYAKEGDGSVSLSCKNGELTVSAESAELGNIDVVIEAEGDDMRLRCNVVYLREALNAIKTHKVEFSHNGAKTPILVTPWKDTGNRQVIMPMV